jgi:hypothetical protein
MPIVEDGMTPEQAEKIAKPAPKGKYVIEITGFIVMKDGGIVHTNDTTGNKMYKVKTKIVNGPYDKDGSLPEVCDHADKNVKTYNAVWGTGLLANFKRAFPEGLTETGGVISDLMLGMTCDADLKVTSYEGQESNEIARLYPKNG